MKEIPLYVKKEKLKKNLLIMEYHSVNSQRNKMFLTKKIIDLFLILSCVENV